MSKKAVLATANSRVQAETLVNQLSSAGFPLGDISVIFPNTESSRDFAVQNSTKAPEGIVTGAGAGGLLGGTLGLLAGIGALAIPGLGPFIAAGPIMAALSGAAIGATVGGIAGGLIAMGIPEYEAKLYEGRVQEGNVLIAVHTETNEQIDWAKDIFQKGGADNISTVTENGVTHIGRQSTVNPPDTYKHQAFGKPSGS